MHQPPHRADPKLLAALERLEFPALLSAAVIAGGALLLWRLPGLDGGVLHVWREMRPPTATAILFVACSLALSSPRRPAFAQAVGVGVSLGLISTSLLALLAYAGVVPLPALRAGALPPLATVVITFLSFLSLLWLRERQGIRSYIADLGAVATGAIPLFLIGGYIFKSIEFFGAVRAPLQTLPTILAMSLCAFVVVARRAAVGELFAFLVSGGLGSRMARIVLPGVIAAPFVFFEAINLLDSAGISSIFRSQAIAAPLIVIATFTIVSWMGCRTNQIEGQLRRQSHTDQLTGLLNQRGFVDATVSLNRTARCNGGGVIAFFFDLDNLKRANDLLGHTAGSQVIQCFADVLAATFRKTDVIGRVGGDEFVVLTPAPVESAADMLQRFARVVAHLNGSEHVPVPISYSVGYAELGPGELRNLDELIAEADVRMYAEKSRKRAA